MVSRWGSVRVAPVTVVATAANLVLLGVAPSWVALAAVLFVAGALDSIADVAENAHGLRVERLYGRSILNSMHGVWSIGAVVGGSMGAAAAGLGVPLVWHLSIAAALFAALAVGVSRFLLPGRDDSELAASPERRSGRPPQIARSVVALGVIAAMAQVMEDSTATWGAVYLRDDLGAAAAVERPGLHRAADAADRRKAARRPGRHPLRRPRRRPRGRHARRGCDGRRPGRSRRP